MKNIINKILVLFFIGFLSFACNEMDLNPLAEGSSEGWYSNDTEVDMSLDYLFDILFWDPNPHPKYWSSGGWYDFWTDDFTNRTALSPIQGGTINSESDFVIDIWNYYYKCIAAANLLIEKLETPAYNLSASKKAQYTGNARFVRARMYSKLIFLWGDVPYFTKTLTVAEAFATGRTAKATILQGIYDDFDYAISVLPKSYASKKYATKGSALGLKARIALFMHDYTTARDAAKACMDLGVYELYPDFGELFYSKTRQTKEAVFSIARSVTLGTWPLGNYLRPENCRHIAPRSNGGNSFVWPSWDLWCSFLCTDGFPIDESPLYNPRNPFENRDPRCSETIAEWGTRFGGIIIQPHPDSLVTTKYVNGTRVTNYDCRSVIQWASFNGINWKKRFNEDWWDDFNTDPEHMVIRYADVLLYYAEAKIELNEIDQSVLDAINMVRARAYKVNYNQVGLYPAVTTTNQSELRKALRVERHMEFAFEGLRHNDIIRWKLAEKVLNIPAYGMIDPPGQKAKLVQTGLYFFPYVTPIDEDGVPDFTQMYNDGYVKVLSVRYFDPTKHYLWPIPAKEILINPNITQNPNY